MTADLEKLLAEATEGPWAIDRYSNLRGANGKPVGVWNAGIAWVSRDTESEANAHLMGMAPNLARQVIALTAETAALRAMAEKLAGELRKAGGRMYWCVGLIPNDKARDLGSEWADEARSVADEWEASK